MRGAVVYAQVGLLDGVDPRGDTFGSQAPRVAIRFKAGTRSSYFPAPPSGGMLDVNRYDVSVLPYGNDETVAEFHTRWRSEQRCPDPAFYEVENSEWVASVGIRTMGASALHRAQPRRGLGDPRQ